MRNVKKVFARIFIICFLAYTTILCVGPFLWVIMSSFKSNKEILDSAFALPKTYNLVGYKMALEMAPIWKFFLNSVLVSAVNTVTHVLFIAMAAYAIARFAFRGKNFFVLALSSSLLVPISALLVPVYLIFTKLNLLDSRFGLILVYAALGLPTTLFILQGTFLAIPREIEESACIDGAGTLRIFFTVVLPIAKSGLAAAATLHFLQSWNEFTFALILTQRAELRTLPLSLNYFTSQFQFNYTALFAAITMAVLPSILAFILLQERITTSLVTGSIKG